MVRQMACNLVEGRAAPLAALERQSEMMIAVHRVYLLSGELCPCRVGVEARLAHVEDETVQQ